MSVTFLLTVCSPSTSAGRQDASGRAHKPWSSSAFHHRRQSRHLMTRLGSTKVQSRLHTFGLDLFALGQRKEGRKEIIAIREGLGGHCACNGEEDDGEGGFE